MTRFRSVPSLSMLLALLAGPLTLGAGEAGTESLDFQEVYQLVKTHVPGVTDAELNEAAVRGMLTALGTKVSLATNGPPADAVAEGPLLSKTEVYDGNVGYVRVVRVAEGLAGQVSDAIHQLDSKERLGGLVLDLRYAGGMDYSAAAAAADLFLAKAQPLLNWGSGEAMSRDKTNAIQLPVAMLVNRETAGAAEALVGMLRFTGTGLVLGGKTAGNATMTREFPLKNGQRLRIATTPVTLGNGAALSADGIKPDIDVNVSAEDERVYYADAFHVPMETNRLARPGALLANSPDATNGSRRVRFNEADLVREHREGNRDDLPRARAPEPDVPVISDPALARAVDLLKGLAVVRQSRS